MSYRYFLLFPFFIFLTACSGINSGEARHGDNPYYDQAFEWRDKGAADSAYRYFDEAKNVFLQQKDSLGAGKCLIQMAIISTNKGDYYGGQEISLQSLAFFNRHKEDQHIYLHANYNNLAIASYQLKDYNSALKFYDAALSLTKDTLDKILYETNKAKAYQELQEYQKAINIYENAVKTTAKNLDLVEKGSNTDSPAINNGHKNEIEYAKALTNLALSRWLQNPRYNPVPEYLSALKIRKILRDLLGQNSSFAHLSDYYANNNSDSALFYAAEMYKTATQLNSPDDQAEALQKLIRLSSPQASKRYFDIYQRLTDSIQNQRNNAKNQFALIRYESERHKADNLMLQKQNTEKKYQITLLIIFIFLLSVYGTFWHRWRKQRLAREAQSLIRENRLKTSKKVHDVVANGLYRVMSELENSDTFDKELLLDKIEDMYEKSRDISHDENPQLLPDFHKRIEELFDSFQSEKLQIIYTGNSARHWENIGSRIKHEIILVLQELLINATKHSRANRVDIYFEHIRDMISIKYTDNGVGISPELYFKNGLTNTENRIQNMNGTIKFDRYLRKGLKIRITVPIN